jgi:capsular polysaccharide biosynthesis protein
VTYRRTIRRTRWIAGLLVAGLTVLGVASGWAVEQARGAQFQASTDVLVQFWSVQGYLLTGQGSTVSTQDVADAATLATSPDVLDLAASRLGKGTDGAALSPAVTVTPQLVSHGITIVATEKTAADAERTSQAVATAMTDTLTQRIGRTAAGLSDVAGGDFRTVLEQRAQVLTNSIQPLQVLRTGTAQQTSPTPKTPIMLGVVGLAAGVLLVIGLVFGRPVVGRARDAQRLVELPSVPFETPQGGPRAGRLLRRLLESRPEGRILIVPVDADAE